MAGRKGRTADEIARDRARVAEMYLAGRYQSEIAQELGLSQQQISYDLQAVRREWQASAVRNFDEAKAQELAKIDHLERTYWQAWQQSIGTTQIKTIKAKGPSPGGAAPTSAEQTIRTEELNGDPRYLAGVMSCIERRCKMLGIDAPDRGTNLNIDLDACTDDELRRIASGEDPIAVLAARRTK